MSQPESGAERVSYPTPLTLVGWGLAVGLLGMWLILAGLDEDSVFITGFGTLVAAPAWAVTAIGVVAQGIRFGMTWVDHDRQTATRSR